MNQIYHNQAITVAELIADLKQFPADAFVNAYEGEGIGIVITRQGSAAFDDSGWVDTPIPKYNPETHRHESRV
jgi:hypothetical protein